jgi:hypothetical protein
MKGVSSIIMVPLILLVAVLVIVSSGVVFFWDKGVVKEADIQSTLYTSWNALQAADLYVSTSVDYSVYQACYDILRWGGFKENGKNWSNIYGGTEHETPPTSDEFLARFKELAKDYTNRYMRGPYMFIEDYNVTAQGSSSLPRLRLDSFKAGLLETSLSASAGSPLYIKRTLNDYMEEIVLEKNIAFDKVYRIPCLGLFAWGTSEHENAKKALKDGVTQEMDKWPAKSAEKTYAGTCAATEAVLQDVQDELFYDLAKDILPAPSGQSLYFQEEKPREPEWSGSVAKGESAIRVRISNAVTKTVSEQNREFLMYVIKPQPDISVEINADCTAEDTSSGCKYSCRFGYLIAATLETAISQKEQKYYPVASAGYPEMDVMNLIMTDRVVVVK